MSTQPQVITFSPSDIDEPGKQQASPATQGTPIPGAQPITFSASDIEPAIEQTVKMYNANTGSPDKPEDVPVSQIMAKQKQGYFPVQTEKQKQLTQADAINPDPVGNALLMGGGGLAKAGADALTSTAAGDAVAGGVDSAMDAVGNAASAAKQAGSRVIQMTEHQLEDFAKAYPHLSKLALHVAGDTAGFGTVMAIYKKLTK